MKKQKSITLNNLSNQIDNLAMIAKDGFEQVDKRFDNVDDRLNKLEQGQEEIKLRLTWPIVLNYWNFKY